MTHIASRTPPCQLSRTLRYAFAARPTPRQLNHAPAGRNRAGTVVRVATLAAETSRPIIGPTLQWMAQTSGDATLNPGLRAQIIHDMTIIVTDTLQQRYRKPCRMQPAPWDAATLEQAQEEIIRSACQHVQALFQPAQRPVEPGDMLSRRLILQQLGNLVILAAKTSSRRAYARSARA